MSEATILKKNQRPGILKNAFFSLLAWVLPLGLSFVATPLILNKLGKKDYGIYVLILGFISYSFTFSIGRSITKYVAEYRAAGERSKIDEVISGVFSINLVIGAVVMILMLFFSQWYVVDILKLDPVDQEEAVYGLQISGLIISLTITSQIFGGILQAYHRFDIFSGILLLTNLLSIAGNIVIVSTGYKIRALLIWNLLTTILAVIVFSFYALRLLDGFKFVVRLSREVFLRLVKYNSAVVLMQIFSNLLVLFERSWITKIYGTEALANYIIPMTLSMMIHMFTGSFMIVIFPVASESHASNDRQQILKIYTKATKIVLALTAFMALTLIAGRILILQNWLGSNYTEISARILIFHTLTFGLLSVCTVFWQIAEGFGYPYLTAMLSLIWLVLTVPLMILLSQSQDLSSLSLARLLGVMIFIPAILYTEHKIFGKCLWYFWGKSLILTILIVTCVFFVESGIFGIFANQKIGLICGALSGGIVYVFLLWLTKYFDREELIWLQSLKERFV